MENKDLNRLKVVLAEKKRTNKWLLLFCLVICATLLTSA